MILPRDLSFINIVLFLQFLGDTSEGPHHHTVEISVERKRSYMTKMLFSACLVTLIAGGVLITTIRDWDYVGLGGGSTVNKNWGASVSVDPWDDDNDSDLITAQTTTPEPVYLDYDYALSEYINTN